MFSKSEKPSAQRRSTPAGPPSIIAANLKITGNLTTDGEIQVDGGIEGDIACGKLTVGQGATISGEISADEVLVRGKVIGHIRARNVHLTRTAEVTGDVWHDSLAIEAGAFIEGHCRRNNAAGAAARPREATALRPVEGSAQPLALARPEAKDARA